MDTAFTKRPASHNVNSKILGSGKNYLMELVSNYFPEKYVININHMSDKAIFHREGIMVRENHETGKLEPIRPIIKNLESKIEDLQEQIETERQKNNNPPTEESRKLIKDNKKRIQEINEEIKDIEQHALKQIDLNNQIILCLDTPQESIYNSLMSLVSQDTKRGQKYEFVEKSGIW